VGRREGSKIIEKTQGISTGEGEGNEASEGRYRRYFKGVAGRKRICCKRLIQG
jgi:hypothetical protein